MLCDECGKNPAVFSVTITSGEGVSNRHLCSDCMKNMESTLAGGNIHSFLSSILGMLSAVNGEDTKPVCSSCGLRFSEFERTGRLGCANCYKDFQKELGPMLQRIHGSSQHVGRKPAWFTAAGNEPTQTPASAEETVSAREELNAQRMDELRQKMDEAVAVENFEAAAQYRDEMRALAQEAGEA